MNIENKLMEFAKWLDENNKDGKSASYYAKGWCDLNLKPTTPVDSKQDSSSDTRNMKLIKWFRPRGKLEKADTVELANGTTSTGYYDGKGDYYEYTSTGQWFKLVSND